MKVRVIFRDREEQVYERVVVNWNTRVIELFDKESKEGYGFIPFEAILVALKEE